MEERRSARSVMQHTFEVGPEEPPASAPPPAPPTDPPLPSVEAPTPPPAPPRPPSGDSLRERQRRWLKERARFEASQSDEVTAGDTRK
jgi:hypothetical protein